MFDTLWQDTRSSLRAMRSQPLIATAAVATLAVGISVNTSIFTIAAAVLDPELPYAAADRLVVGYGRNVTAGIARGNVTSMEVVAWNARPAFDALGAYELADFNFAMRSGASTIETERVAGARASTGLFDALRISPVIGRLFDTSEERPGGNRVAIIAYSLWDRRFASSPSALGSTIMLHGLQHTVIGVLPERFVLAGAEVWVPLAVDASRATSTRRSLIAVGRLAPRASLTQARSQLAQLSKSVAERQPDAFRGWTVDVMPLREWAVGQRRQVLRVLQIAVFVVLLIACSNIANVQLARGAARRREMALRSALGAGRARLARHLLTEGLILSLIGAAGALVLARVEMGAARAALPADVPRWVAFRIDGAALAFTLLLATGTALVFGLAPALHASRAAPGEILHDDSRTASGSRRVGRTRSLLLAGQLALAMTLFVIAAVLVRFSLTLQRADPGFDPANAISARLTLPESTYRTDEGVRAFHRAVLERVRAMPRVRGVALTTALPAMEGGRLVPVRAEGGTGPGRDSAAFAQSRSVSAAYFDVLGVRRIAGAAFTAADVSSGPVVAINEATARALFSNGNAMGQLLTVGAGDSSAVRARIVAVVRDTSGIEEGATPWGIYRPLDQVPSRSVVIVVKSTGDLTDIVRELRQVVQAADPLLPMYEVRALSDAVRRQIWAPRALGFLLGVLATLALGLSMLGVYGVAAYGAVQQRREIGIRLALGAPPRNVVLLIVRRSLRLAAAGVIVGAVGALLGSRVLSARLGVPASTSALLLGSALVLAGATMAASYLPSRRAASIDPLLTLRDSG